ncbi:innexin inx3-like [Palaemon carinicauda]|uniref:innexin inx3-like n=1 Tax=Palaemon carinicauda TaxID=392227 RepID=UPI0035B5BF30
MVLAVLGSLAGIAKVRYSYTPVDSHVFRLHYRWTTTFCFACCALVVAQEYVGNAIECIVSNAAEAKPITTYCWITSTFTINSTGSFMKGVGPYRPAIHERRFHSYYQWVPLVLFMQGCIFYVPHLFWKSCENKRLDVLLQDLNKGLFHDDADKKKENILKYWKESWGVNSRYVTIYHFSEAVNFINVILQMYAMDEFFGGFFWEYGTKVLSVISKSDAERHDALVTIFPRMTKCHFKKIGASGTIETRDVLCILPQNIVNEKIFLVMWLWFVILAAVTGAWLIYRTVLMFSSALRLTLLQYLAKDRFTDRVEKAINLLPLGDFCLLENIGYNLDVLNFRDIVRGVPDLRDYSSPSAPPPRGTYRRFDTPSAPEIYPKLHHIN